jgi:hypothetical protein
MRFIFVFLVLLFFMVFKDTGYNPYSISETMSLLLLLALFILSLSFYLCSKNSAAFSEVGLFLLLTLIVVFLNSFNLNSIESGLASVILHFKYFLLAFSIPFLVRGGRSEKNVILFMVVFGVSVCFAGFIKHGGFSSLIGSLIYGVPRYWGVFPNPNVNAIFICFTISFYVLLVKAGYISISPIVSIVFFLSMFILLLATGSRRGYVFLISFFVFICFSESKTYNVLIVLALISSLVLFVGTMFFEPLWEYFLLFLQYRDEGNETRLGEVWELFNGFGSDWFMLGEGLGRVGPPASIGESQGVVIVHNYYSWLLQELGILGLIVYIFVLYRFMRVTKHSNTSSKYWSADNVLRATLFSVILSGLFGIAQVTFPINLYFALVAGLLFSRILARDRFVHEV